MVANGVLAPICDRYHCHVANQDLKLSGTEQLGGDVVTEKPDQPTGLTDAAMDAAVGGAGLGVGAFKAVDGLSAKVSAAQAAPGISKASPLKR